MKITAKNCQEIILKHTSKEQPFDVVFDLDKSKGVTLIDKKTGRAFIDCISFIASAPLGFNHSSLDDKDFEKKLLRAAKTKPNNAEFHTIEYAEFIDSFKKNLMKKDFERVFFIDGGASAMDNAIKTAIDWKFKKDCAKKFIRPESLKDSTHINKIIYFDHSYHGRNGYSLSVTHNQNKNTTAVYPRQEWIRIDEDCLEDNNGIWTLTPFIQEQIDRAFCYNEISAVILEPIQSVGGNNQFDKLLMKYLRSSCDRYDSLLIFDEVQTGIGQSGKMWAYQWYDGIKPDIVVFGKKTQVCGFMINERVYEVEENVFDVASRLSSTWTGSLCDMVRATKYLDVIKKDKLLDNVNSVSEYFYISLTALSLDTCIDRVRGLGFLIAFDLPTAELRNMFLDLCFDHGIIILGCGTKGIRLRPALIFSKENVNDVISIFRNVLSYGDFSL